MTFPFCVKQRTLSRFIYLNFAYPNVYVGNAVRLYFQNFKTFITFIFGGIYLFMYSLQTISKMTLSILICSKLLFYTFWISKLEL